MANGAEVQGGRGCIGAVDVVGGSMLTMIVRSSDRAAGF